jgi:2,4-didehydro-3-deoxy-L-rhamnonate hydrolase
VNYTLHLEEAKSDHGINLGKTIRTIAEAGVFLKANSSLIGPNESVVAGQFGRRTDHEIELAFVIGRGGRNISEADALHHVAGYSIGLDMTIRGVEDRSYRKSLDTFTVLGPWLVTPEEFGDPADCDFEIKVNGESRQKSNTKDLIFSVRKLISYMSQAFELCPGDIVLSGTPEGVGPVVPGDKMDCWIDRIGSMTVRVTGGN